MKFLRFADASTGRTTAGLFQKADIAIAHFARAITIVPPHHPATRAGPIPRAGASR